MLFSSSPCFALLFASLQSCSWTAEMATQPANQDESQMVAQTQSSEKTLSTEAADSARSGKNKAKIKSSKANKAKPAVPSKETAADIKSATASREDNLIYDLKHMAAFDISPIPSSTDLASYSRDSVQLLVNKIFALPRSELDIGTAVALPKEEVFRLPRSKPIPKEKPKTRWQKFMEERNMKKKKRSRLVYDEISEDWKPRYGYKSAKKSAEKTKWFHEVADGSDPNENPFDRAKAEQRLLKARQKLREVRNKVEAAGGKLRASVPDLSSIKTKRGKDGLKEAIKRAQVSSASRGKFDRLARNEAPQKRPKKFSR